MSALDTWMPLHIKDYLADTDDLTIEQSGAYLHLLMRYWISGPLPDDDARLGAICKVTRTYFARHIGPAIRPYFTAQDGRLTQKRADAEREKKLVISAKRSEAASNRAEKPAKNPAKTTSFSQVFNGKTVENPDGQINDFNDLGQAKAQANAPVLHDTSTSTETEERIGAPFQGVSKPPADNVTRLRDLAVAPSLFPLAVVPVVLSEFDAASIWNRVCGPVLPKVANLSTERKATMRRRIKEWFSEPGSWEAYCTRIAASSMLTGGNDRGWTCNFDWVLKPANFTKIVEGNYDNRRNVARPTMTPAQAGKAASYALFDQIASGSSAPSDVPDYIDMPSMGGYA